MAKIKTPTPIFIRDRNGDATTLSCITHKGMRVTCYMEDGRRADVVLPTLPVGTTVKISRHALGTIGIRAGEVIDFGPVTVTTIDEAEARVEMAASLRRHGEWGRRQWAIHVGGEMPA